MTRLYPLCILLSLAGASALGAQQAVKPDSARRAAQRDAIVRLRHAPGAVASAVASDGEARAAALRRVLGDRAAAATASASVAPTDSTAERRARQAAIESARRARPR